VTNFVVKIRVTDKDVSLRPGMSATADIETQTVKDVVAIPIQSVTVRAAGGMTAEDLEKKNATDSKDRSGNEVDQATAKADAARDREKLLRVVFIREGDKVRMQRVETGIADNSMIEIKSGLRRATRWSRATTPRSAAS
jgi:HlyD family secretion protein